MYDRFWDGPIRDKTDCGSFLEACRRLQRGVERITIVDFGCGAAEALGSLQQKALSESMNTLAVGLDKDVVGPVRPSDSRTLVKAELHSAATGGSTNIQLVRCDLNDALPISRESVHLAISSKLLMFLSEKLLFLERVWDTLAPGGLAVLEVDVGEGQIETPRLCMPRPLHEVVHSLANQGLDVISWQVEAPLRHQSSPAPQSQGSRRSCVLSMLRHHSAERLRFNYALASSEPFQNSDAPIENWGVRSLQCK